MNKNVCEAFGTSFKIQNNTCTNKSTLCPTCSRAVNPNLNVSNGCKKKGRQHDLVIVFAEETHNKDAKRKTFTMTNPNF